MGVPAREQCTTFQQISTMSNLSEVPVDDSVTTQNSVAILYTAGTFEQEVSQLQPSSDVQAEKVHPILPTSVHYQIILFCHIDVIIVEGY